MKGYLPKNKAKFSLLWVTPYLLSEYGDGIHERALVEHISGLDADLRVVSINKIPVGKKPKEKNKKTIDLPHLSLLPALPPYFISGFFWAVAVSLFLAITRQSKKFDAICIRDIPMALGFAATKKLHRLPVAVRVGGFLSDESLRWFKPFISRQVSALFKVMEEYALANVDLVVAYSQKLIQELVQNHNVNSQKILLSTVGVDFEEFKPRSQNSSKDHTQLIGYAGSMAPWQGLDILVDAICLLQTEMPKLRLLVVTKDSPSQALKDHIKTCGLEDKITFRSIPHSRMSEMYSSIDVLVIPRYGRNTDYAIPIKLFEACAAGKVIVVSATPSISSIMTDKCNCLLFNPGDYKDLSSKIKTVLADESLRRNLGEAAKQLALAYSWEKIAAHLYDDLKQNMQKRLNKCNNNPD